MRSERHNLAGILLSMLVSASALFAQVSHSVGRPAVTGSQRLEPPPPPQLQQQPQQPQQLPQQIQQQQLQQQLQQFRSRRPSLFELVRELPPEEQQRVLVNSIRFQRLPADRQMQILQNLQRWNGLTPERKQILREREEIWRSLSPPQRQQLRAVFPLYQRLAPERRQELMRAFLRLRDVPAGERPAFFTSAEAVGLSANERAILGQLAQLLP